MATQRPQTFSSLNAVTGVAGILFGVIVGYIIGAGQATGSATGFAAPPADNVHTTATAPAPTAVVTDADIQAFKNVMATDPKNPKPAIELGNKLYDAGRYAEAIGYYQQALANDPKNASVSTDMATAMYYVGRTDEALAQLDKSLTVDPAHGQTHFNIGIIKRDGKKDAKGAVEAWERLLKTNPGYPEADKVRALIAETK
jgi:tetratricopeptide (TPR) repeat protein